MKATWIILLLTFSLKGFSQDTLASVIIHTWAGGYCCSSGTDISITLSDQWGHADFDSLVYVSSNGQTTLLFPDDFHVLTTTQKPICTLTYGWKSMYYGNAGSPDTWSFYGLPGSRFRNNSGEIARLLIYRNRQLIKEGKVKEQFTMTAYP